ncbi:hypothetical protein DESC_580015 [Desulfosarcina cetonica]|nr:hypothetical protein DESC_580015 [Desulfosarcina cetonica]
MHKLTTHQEATPLDPFLRRFDNPSCGAHFLGRLKISPCIFREIATDKIISGFRSVNQRHFA